MGFESVYLLAMIEVDCYNVAGATLALATDRPAPFATRETRTIPTNTSRRAERIRLAGTSKGKLIKPAVTPAGVFYLYGMRVWARELPTGQWTWYQIPLIETPSEWMPVKWPIPPTPEEYIPVKWPIPATPDEYVPVKWPVDPSRTTYEWVNVQMDE